MRTRPDSPLGDDGQEASATRPDTLPPGRHGLEHGYVTDHQRQRLLDAVTAVVAREGYASTVVEDLVAEAHVSRRTFYENFANRDQAFLAAHRAAIDACEAALTGPQPDRASWRVRVRSGLGGLLERLTASPDMARLVFVEGPASGLVAREPHAKALRCAAALLEGGYAEAPEPAPPIASDMAARTIFHLIHQRVASGESDLLDLLPDAVYCAVVPFLGPVFAAREARRAGRDAAERRAER